MVAGSAGFASVPGGAVSPKRPRRWSVRNWPVRWKVLAIALVPMALALLFGGMRVSHAMTDARELRRAADRAEMIPAISDYMAAFGGVLLAGSAGGDVPGAMKTFEGRKAELQSRLADTDVAGDVSAGVTALLNDGQELLEQAAAGAVAPRDLAGRYSLILLPAENAVDGSVRIDNERLRNQAEGIGRAIGARGQMMLLEMLVNRGGEIPPEELHSGMMAVAGTEPSTLFGVTKVLGVNSPDAKKLQQLFVNRMTLIHILGF